MNILNIVLLNKIKLVEIFVYLKLIKIFFLYLRWKEICIV